MRNPSNSIVFVLSIVPEKQGLKYDLIEGVRSVLNKLVLYSKSAWIFLVVPGWSN
jgi:hypothetical protein